MQKNVKVIKSKRRTLSLYVNREGEIIVKSPLNVSDERIEEFIYSHRRFIENRLKEFNENKNVIKFTQEERKSVKVKAEKIITEKLKFYSEKIGVRFDRVSFRFNKTLWGSCTAKGNLNFNCLLIYFPDSVIDYVVIHELCHRKYMNHSKHFWAEVEKYMPDYKIRRKYLKEKGNALLRRI